ncbi:hypothetical protein [Mycobacteroides abscessus]|uniref:hypothetical protein n=1 Tax=Mycobacteroides abscessus TaxID=36809 RepID=UPI002106195C|nr:hypothetical protein [Mycobacteroides abscessus]
MSVPSADVDPHDENASSASEEIPRPGFHERDPFVIAEEAVLGEHGALQVERAQDFYRQVFELVDDLAWPNDPVGPLGNEWRGIGGPQSTHYLINIAGILTTLMASASPGVGRTITQRLRTMLRPPDDHAYEEALVELEVGGMIASRVSPVVLEPLVPRDWTPAQGRQPTSPDYGVHVPEGMVTVEVTVWHWEAYAAWQRMSEAIQTALSARMLKRGVARNVRIELPIGSPNAAVEYLWSHQFCDRVCDNAAGAIMTSEGVTERPIRATWRPMLHFPGTDSIDWDAVAANGGLPFTAGPNIGHSFGYSVNPCINQDDHIDALDSLRRSIDRKKRQRQPNTPHLVAISPTFPQIAVSPNEFARTWDVFGPLIDQRLWPNPKYRWLSGILEHNTNRAAPPTELTYFVGYTPNPNASIPVPMTMERALRGEADFHVMWQRPGRLAAQ